MASSCRGCLQTLRRAILTLFVMIMMFGSLLACSTPFLICILDVLLPWILLSTRLGYASDLRVLWASYSFGSSLLDIPTISLLRSLVIICVYSVSDALGLSFGPYLWTTVSCGLVSGVLIFIRACLVMASSTLESPSAESRGFQHPWSMLEMLSLSITLALGHIVVAHRTRCKARRKMLHFLQLDPEAVPVYNNGFHRYQNLPCSPTPNMGRIVKGNSEEKCFFDGGKHLPSRALPDGDSLFMLCEGLVIHYKITKTSHSYTSSALHDSHGGNYGSMLRMLKFDNQLLPRFDNLARKFGHTLTNKPLYTPLLSDSSIINVNPGSKYGSKSYSGFSEHIPLLNLEKYKHNKLGSVDKLSEPRRQKFGCMGVILIHGFGGGVFSWRYVMSPLERQTGCTVAAFDRPGWGLTSCPSKSEWELKRLPNSCELESQVGLLSSFCQKLAFSSVVLIGHDDGGLLALMTAERLYKSRDISNVEVKGIVLVGAEDLAQLNLAQASVSGIQNIRVVTISNCGHLPHEECPTVLLAALVPFVSELKMELTLK